MNQIFVFIALLLSACQTAQPLTDFHMPEKFNNFFAYCDAGDGLSSLQLYREGRLQGAAEMEWIAERDRGWHVVILNPVGQTMLDLVQDSTNKTVTSKGELASRVPKVEITDDGFLEVDG